MIKGNRAGGLFESEQQYPCAYCGRKAGDPCVRKDGRVTSNSHAPRLNAWFRAGLANGSIKAFGLRITKQQ